MSGTPATDGAERWNQVQELLFGEHRRSTEAGLVALGQTLAGESERLEALYSALERRHVELMGALQAEVSKREALERTVQALSQSHVSREDLAGRLRRLADKLQEAGE